MNRVTIETDLVCIQQRVKWVIQTKIKDQIKHDLEKLPVQRSGERAGRWFFERFNCSCSCWEFEEAEECRNGVARVRGESMLSGDGKNEILQERLDEALCIISISLS